MATVEGLRTQVDALQWEINRLQAENRRLREENPEVDRAVALERELEQSQDEVARLTDRVSECERQVEAERTLAATALDERGGESSSELAEALVRQQAVTEQLEAKRRLASGLRESLRRSEARGNELVETLDAKEAELRRRIQEEEREREVAELHHYRALEAAREKWEAREQRALDELDRLRGEKTGCEYTALSGQLEEAQQEQRTLKEALSQAESLIDHLRGQQEEYQLENGELRGVEGRT